MTTLLDALQFGRPSGEVGVHPSGTPQGKLRQGIDSPSLPVVQAAIAEALSGGIAGGSPLPAKALKLADLFGVDPTQLAAQQVPATAPGVPSQPEQGSQAAPSTAGVTTGVPGSSPIVRSAAANVPDSQPLPPPPAVPDMVPVATAPVRDITGEQAQQQEALSHADIIPALAQLIGGLSGGNLGTSAGRMADVLSGTEAGQDRRFGQAEENYKLAADQSDTLDKRQAEHYQQGLGGFSAMSTALDKRALANVKDANTQSLIQSRLDATRRRAIDAMEAVDGTPEQKLSALRAQIAANPKAFEGMSDADLRALSSRTPLKLQAAINTSQAAIARSAAIVAREKDYAQDVKNKGAHYHATEANARARTEIDRANMQYLYGYRYSALAQSGDEFDQRMAMALDKARGTLGGNDPSAIRELTPLISQAGKLDAEILQYKKALYSVYKQVPDGEEATPGQQLIIGSATESIRKAEEEQQKIAQRISEKQDAIDAKAVKAATSAAAQPASTGASGSAAKPATTGRSSIGDRARSLMPKGLRIGAGNKTGPPSFQGNPTPITPVSQAPTGQHAKPTAHITTPPVLTPEQQAIRDEIYSHLAGTHPK